MENSSKQSTSPQVMFLNEHTKVENWKHEQILGSGAFATITLWVNTETDERIALKQYKNNLDCLNTKQRAYYYERWKQEIKIMKKITCENVVKALDLPREFLSLKMNIPILAMEFCSGGDLRKALNKPKNCCGLTEKEVRQILKQISSAIEYLHQLNIIHRDLKPENIVLHPLPFGKILYKLIDLGYAKQLSDSTLANSFVGTFEYLAPELFLGIQYSSAVDNWSFGLLAYEVITGRRPFLPNHSMAKILEILKDKKSSDICTEFDETGNFSFSSEISHINQICSTLKNELESWLKIVLEYDPGKRGDRKAFQLVAQIMNKYMVQVFSIETYELFSYEIKRETKLEDLKEMIFSNTNIMPVHQYIILPNGEMARTDIGEQIIDSWYTPQSLFEHYNPIVMYIFDYSKQLIYQEIYKSLTLPPMVENMLLETSRVMEFDELKMTWRNSVWVAQQTVRKYALLQQALKSSLLNCINLFNILQNKTHNLAVSQSSLFSSIIVLKKYIKYVCGQFKSRTSFSQSESTTIRLFAKIVTNDLKRIYSFRNDKIKSLFDRVNQSLPKFNKESFVFENFFKSSEIHPSLLKSWNDIQNGYDYLRKKKHDERNKQCASNLVILLCNCFKLVESLTEKMHQILSIFVKYIQTIEEPCSHNKKLQIILKDYGKLIDQHHETIWRQIQLCHSFPNSANEQSRFDAYSSVSQTLQNGEDTNCDTRQLLEQLVLDISDLDKEDSRWQSVQLKFNQLEFQNFFL